MLGLAARAFLIEHGYPVEWHDYAIPHSVCLEEIEEIGSWLRQVMGAIDGSAR